MRGKKDPIISRQREPYLYKIISLPLKNIANSDRTLSALVLTFGVQSAVDFWGIFRNNFRKHLE